MSNRERPTWLATWGLEKPETEAEREDRLRKAEDHTEFLERCVEEWAEAGVSPEGSLIGDHSNIDAILEDGAEEKC